MEYGPDFLGNCDGEKRSAFRDTSFAKKLPPFMISTPVRGVHLLRNLILDFHIHFKDHSLVS